MSELKCSAIGCVHNATTITNGDALCAFHYEHLMNALLEKHKGKDEEQREVKQ